MQCSLFLALASLLERRPCLLLVHRGRRTYGHARGDCCLTARLPARPRTPPCARAAAFAPCSDGTTASKPRWGERLPVAFAFWYMPDSGDPLSTIPFWHDPGFRGALKLLNVDHKIDVVWYNLVSWICPLVSRASASYMGRGRPRQTFSRKMARISVPDECLQQFDEEDKARLEQSVRDNIYAFIFAKGCWHSPTDKLMRATLIRVKAPHVKTGAFVPNALDASSRSKLQPAVMVAATCHVLIPADATAQGCFRRAHRRRRPTRLQAAQYPWRTTHSSTTSSGWRPLTSTTPWLSTRSA